MSVNGNTHDHDRGDDAAAYALGALEPREAADYLRHLTICTRCREELAALAPVADGLASTVPQVPVGRTSGDG
jgi:anti-sigma factor ChrR (cupin superfamily)